MLHLPIVTTTFLFLFATGHFPFEDLSSLRLIRLQVILFAHEYGTSRGVQRSMRAALGGFLFRMASQRSKQSCVFVSLLELPT